VDSLATNGAERNSAGAEAQQAARRFRGVSYVKPITTAKELVSTLNLARLLCGDTMSETGGKWQACCPLPDHDDKTPSFFVFGDGGWWCFGCLRGGDVVELARLAWGYYQRDAHVAAANLLHEFGHEIPKRAPAWFRKQERQKQMRDTIAEAKVEVMTRRLWRYTVEPLVAEIEDPEERTAAAERLWSKVEFRARQLVRAREEEREA
jgi:hypothetical protein